MPGKVKVKIVAGRNLPVMDRSSDTTDAYVEIKLGGVTHKTDVARKTLHPVWNSDWFRFEMDDSDLQDEPLQIRLMDYDTYSANNAIGKVNINLNPLLLSMLDTSMPKGPTSSAAGKGVVMSGWIPVFDTMNGIRGEVEIIVKVDLFIDVNKFRQSSCGVQFFHSPNIPHGYHVPPIHGFVEELIVNDDPEYQWIDKIRTPRASNEARQVVFLKLSAQVQRKMGLKASEMGANAVIGYRFCLDLEGDVGVAARGIGTAVTLVKIPENIQATSLTENTLIEENESTSSSTLIPDAKGSTTTTTDETLPSSPVLLNVATAAAHSLKTDSISAKLVQSPTKVAAAPASAALPSSVTAASSATATDINSICRRSSDSDLSVTPKGNSVTSCERGPGATSVAVGNPAISVRMAGHMAMMKTTLNTVNVDMLEYPFLTLDKFPPGFIVHLGSTVCARSVKLLERVPNPDEPEVRDGFWTELRMEIRSHARSLGCNVVLGYTESTTITDDVCVLTATGTAALINMQYVTDLSLHGSTGNLGATKMTSSLDRSDFEKNGEQGKEVKGAAGRPDDGVEPMQSQQQQEKWISCSVTHIPYNISSVPFNVSMETCAVCRRAKVPDVLVATIEIPGDLQVLGRGCLVQAQVCRSKRDLKSESNAKEISDALPFLECELHRLLINKLKIKGMNSMFGLRSSLAIGEKMITLIATGTGVFLNALPAPTMPKIIGAKIDDIQKTLKDTMEKNREHYHVIRPSADQSDGAGPGGGGGSGGVGVDGAVSGGAESGDSDDEAAIVVPPPKHTLIGDSMDLTLNNKDICILEVDDIVDMEVIALLMEPAAPEGYNVVNTRTVPGLSDAEVASPNLQYFVQVWRGKLVATHTQNQFAKSLQRLLQGIYYKLRTMTPCAISGLRFTVALPDAEWVQVLITGMALGLTDSTKTRRRRTMTQSMSKDRLKRADDELIFNLEDESLTTDSRGTATTTTTTTSNCLTPVSGKLPHTPGSFRLKNKSPSRTKAKMSRNGQLRDRYGVDIVQLDYVPGGRIEKYLGNLNFFFIRESTSIRESGGICGFVHGFIAEVLAVVRAHTCALGGNAMVSFYMTEMILDENVHKNQGQSLVSVGGDVVFVSYFVED